MCIEGDGVVGEDPGRDRLDLVVWASSVNGVDRIPLR